MFFHELPVSLRSNIRNDNEKGTDYYPLLQAARMIESELKADHQYKTSDKVKSKADKRPKAKEAASSVSAEKDLNSLEKAWE